MNPALKALLSLLFDGLAVGQDALAKKNIFQIMPDCFPMLSDLLAVVSNDADIMPEIKALPGSAQEADLIAFIEAKFGALIPSGKAQAILDAALKVIVNLVQDALALQAAIKA